MKVRELIEKLREFDPELEVVTTIRDGFDVDDIYRVGYESDYSAVVIR